MDRETSGNARQYYSSAEKAQQTLATARGANTELAFAKKATSAAHWLTDSYSKSAMMLGGVAGTFGLGLLVDNPTFSIYSQLPITIAGGLAIGESTKLATRLHRRRVKNNGRKGLNQNISQIPSIEIKLATVREAVKDLMEFSPEKPIKAGEVERWIVKKQIRVEHKDDPRVEMATRLHERVKEFVPQNPERTTIPAMMRAQAESLKEKGNRSSISGEARRMISDLAIGEGAVISLFAATDYYFGSKYGVIVGGGDDIALVAGLILFTPVKRLLTSEAAHDIYDTTKQAYKKIAFWKRDELPQEPIRLLEAPKQDQSIDAIILNPNDEIIIDSTQDFGENQLTNFPS
jgi:hypothetical protein